MNVELKRKRAFRKFTYRGVELDALLVSHSRGTIHRLFFKLEVQQSTQDTVPCPLIIQTLTNMDFLRIFHLRISVTLW